MKNDDDLSVNFSADSFLKSPQFSLFLFFFIAQRRWTNKDSFLKAWSRLKIIM